MATETESTTEMVDDDNAPEVRTPPKPSVPEDLESLRAEHERTKTALAKANKEATARRHRLEELEAAERERETANLSEAERIKREIRDARDKAAEFERLAIAAQTALDTEKINNEIERQATKMGFVYPDTVHGMIEPGRVEKDPETGKIIGVKEALERLAKERPKLIEAAPRGGSPPREGPRTRFNDRDRERGPSIEEELRMNRNYSV